MKNLGIIFILIPFVFTALGFQAFVWLRFGSESINQLFAYSKVLSLLLGIFLLFRDERRTSFPILVKFWILFYMFYFGIGLWGNIIHDNEVQLLKTFIRVIYFFAFAIFFSIQENRKIFEKVLIVTFLISNMLLVYFERINFSMDHQGVTAFTLDRAGGVYGDANNASVVTLLLFIFIVNIFKAKTKFQEVVKVLILIFALYCLVLSFSKTGFIVLFIVLGLTYHSLFNRKKILFALLLIPIGFYFLVSVALSSSYLNITQKERIQDLFNILTLNTSEVSLSHRDDLFLNMWYYITESPILGNGLNFSASIGGHNTIFGIWADAGIFCFLLFLFLMLQYALAGINSSVDKKYFSLSILTVLFIYMLTLETILDQGYLIAVFVYLAYLVDDKSRQRNYSLL